MNIYGDRKREQEEVAKLKKHRPMDISKLTKEEKEAMVK
jgi:hypothetical protein